jgi:hypothetical protein
MVRVALIGGLVGIVVQGILGFLIKNALWVAIATMLMIVLGRCTPENPKYESKRNLLNSFDHKAVLVTNVRGIVLPGSTYVSSIAADLYNGGKARIYDLRLACQYHLLSEKGQEESGGESERSRITSDYLYRYVRPGTSLSVQLGVHGDGYLGLTDPQSFRCEPKFEVETIDLLKESS